MPQLTAPVAHRAIWKIISPWLDPRTKEKVFFLTNGDECERTLRRFIAPEILPACYGGLVDGDSIPIPNAPPPPRRDDDVSSSGDGEEEEFHEALHPRHFGLAELPAAQLEALPRQLS